MTGTLVDTDQDWYSQTTIFAKTEKSLYKTVKNLTEESKNGKFLSEAQDVLSRWQRIP